jgi:hypothetical protein
MRPGVPVLAAAVSLAAAAPVHADEWTLIDVKSRLTTDARVTVVETHDIVLDTTGRNTFRTFGLGADQAIRLTALTRIGADGEPRGRSPPAPGHVHPTSRSFSGRGSGSATSSPTGGAPGRR